MSSPELGKAKLYRGLCTIRGEHVSNTSAFSVHRTELVQSIVGLGSRHDLDFFTNRSMSFAATSSAVVPEKICLPRLGCSDSKHGLALSWIACKFGCIRNCRALWRPPQFEATRQPALFFGCQSFIGSGPRVSEGR